MALGREKNLLQSKNESAVADFECCSRFFLLNGFLSYRFPDNGKTVAIKKAYAVGALRFEQRKKATSGSLLDWWQSYNVFN